MKKTTIIITSFSILISIITCIIIIFTSEKASIINENQKFYHNVSNETDAIKNNLADSNNKYEHYYTELNLDKKNFIAVNECMQLYLKGEDFTESNKCEKVIVNALIQEEGETNLIKAVLGDMLSYSRNEVYLKHYYFSYLISHKKSKSNLKQNLILAFINRYRDPIELKKLYKNTKEYLYNYMSRNVYENLYKERINLFISSFNEIQSKPNKELFYSEIYEASENQNDQDKYWFYTFWARRELEKNDLILYRIFKEINEYYTR
ncbi:hypothetical protein [Tenacibaculum ovolyticum]|uniref:hypothetical protein n=1 Tax=Tenacibaculum ovolyticum TaxID=104270 RepID=UPI003BAB555E